MPAATGHGPETASTPATSTVFKGTHTLHWARVNSTCLSIVDKVLWTPCELYGMMPGGTAPRG